MSLGQDGARQISIHGLLHPSDSMLISLNAASKPVRTEIATDLDKDLIHIELTYSTLPDGVVYPADTTIRIPKKKLEIKNQTFNYQLSGAVGPS